MWITNQALRRRATVFFLLAVALAAGLTAYATLPRESTPDIQVPVIMVYTLYPGATPADIESQITRPIERELRGLSRLKELSSISQESVSLVVAEFESGSDLDAALQRVRDRVDRAKVDFPDDAEDPVLQEIAFTDIPIVQVHISGEVGPVVLKRLAEDLQDELESIPGVLRAQLVGGREREVRVDVDPQRLRAYRLSLDDVVEAIEDENVTIPGGDFHLGERTLAVRVPGEVEDPLAVGDFVIRSWNARPVYVRDVANVSFGFKDRDSHSRIGGEESVALLVQKRVGFNIIEVAERVKEIVERAEATWPAGVSATLLGDQSKYVRDMVRDLENNILTGLVLVVAVLLFVLGFRTALFVALAIPVSMVITFAAVQATGTTLNMVVLFALVLAVGMLVDNAVVVIENIYRHMQEGQAPLDAAATATKEVGTAIATSTFTTVGAFFPLLFWPGIVGDFMSYLPMTVSLALLASLLVATTVSPVVCATFLRPGREVRPPIPVDAAGEPEEAEAEIPGWQATIGAWILNRYRRSLEWALDHRAATIGIAVGLFALVVVLFGLFNRGVEFFPETEPPQIVVDVDMPPGTRLEATDAVIRELEERLLDIPDLRVMAAASGAGSQAEFGGGGPGDATIGRIVLDLADRPERSQSSFRTMEEVRRRVASVPGASIEVKRPQEGPPVGDPLAIRIAGDDFATLGGIAARIRGAIDDIPHLVSLDDDFDLARPELVVRVDRTEAARLGLTTARIAGTLRTAVTGTEASIYRYGEDEADITVRLAEPARSTVADLERLRIVTDDGEQIPLEVVARFETGASLTSIRRQNQRRTVTVSGDVTSPQMAEPVRRAARERIAAMGDLLPPGYTLTFVGQSEEEDMASEFLSGAFFYAILIVLALMVSKFNSLALPLIVLTSVVMSMVGVLVGLLVTGLPFGIIMTGVGVISLAGIVVNNAIVLLDYGEQQRALGLPRRQVVVHTGMVRLRPVLLTAITTILGLLPLTTGFEFDFRQLALVSGGESSQWWRGMGVAVIFGLGFATFLTLLVVPVLYDLWFERRERRRT